MLEHQRRKQQPARIAGRSEARAFARENGGGNRVVEPGRGLPCVYFVALGRNLPRERRCALRGGSECFTECAFWQHRFQRGLQRIKRTLAPNGPHYVERHHVRCSFPDGAEVRVTHEASIRPFLDVTAAAAHLHRIAGRAARVAARAEFEQRLTASGVIDRARFTGAVNFDKVPQYFHQIDVLVLPTETTKRVREQFGRVLVEAMASGIPVIGSTCGAIPEVIGDAGLVFREANAESLAGALRQALSDKALRERVAEAGLARVERYSWERVAEKTYQLYKDVLSLEAASFRKPSVEFAS